MYTFRIASVDRNYDDDTSFDLRLQVGENDNVGLGQSYVLDSSVHVRRSLSISVLFMPHLEVGGFNHLEGGFNHVRPSVRPSVLGFVLSHSNESI